MSEQVSEDTVQVKLNVKFYPEPSEDGESEAIVMRQVVLGMGPTVLIEFVEAAEDTVGIQISASEFDSDDLVELFEMIADGIKRAKEEQNDGN